MAKLYFRYGAMNSGKSTALMQAAHNYEERKQAVCVVKPKVDTKGGSAIVSRLGLVREPDVLIGQNDDALQQIGAFLDAHDVACVLVDEAQFLAREHADQLMELAVLRGVPVMAYGLRTDFLGNPFPGAQRLLEIAHTLEELKTICECGSKAMFNARLVNGEITFTGDQVAIDGQAATYESLCASCYFSARRDSL